MIGPDDEPACWSWPVPPLRTRDEHIEDLLAAEQEKPPGCRYGRAGIELMLDGDATNGRWSEFHQRRCAICGLAPVDGHLIQDHCHKTGQIRGLLCRSCNVREGTSPLPLFIRYRRIHPAAILDMHEMYSGRHWELGWWLGEVRDPYERGERPPTPWPPWRKEDPLDGPPGGHIRALPRFAGDAPVPRTMDERSA